MRLHRIVYIVNFILAAVLLRFLHNAESDKAPGIYFFIYVFLIGTNLVIGVLGNFDRGPASRYFFRAALGLVILLFLFLGIEVFLGIE